MTSEPWRDEVELVQRVYDRLAAAATDEELQDGLFKYLTPVVAKLASSHDAVRNKILEVLGHVNRRVKEHQHIQLPVDGLLTQFNAPATTSAFVLNFSLVYIKMGFPRLDENKQVELLPKLLASLDGKPAHQQDSLLMLVLPVLGLVKLSSLQDDDASPFQVLKDKPSTAKLLLDYMQDVLLLPYGATPSSEQQLLLLQQQRQARLQLRQQREQELQQVQGGQNIVGGDNQDDDLGLEPDELLDRPDVEQDTIPVAGVPAGMSISGFCRAAGDEVRAKKPEQLEKLKLAVVRFLDLEVLRPSSMAIPLVIAASDTRFAVANMAESLLRRLDRRVEWNSNPVISSMYVLFLGTLTPIGRGPLQRFKNPSNTRIRLKLMPCFLKSKECTNFSPLAVKVFCECLWGVNTNTKLKQQGITFLHHISHSASTEKLKPVGSMLFSGVVKVIEEEKNDAKLTSLAYGALAKLSLKLPNLLLSHPSQLHYLQTLMDALTHEVGDVLLAVQEALSMVAPVCNQLTPQSQELLCIMLSEHVQHDNQALRRTAVHYAASVFPQTHCQSRFILLLATGDSQDDIRKDAQRELYRGSASKNKDGSDTKKRPSLLDSGQGAAETPGFCAMMTYVTERIDARPRSRWFEVANNPLPYTMPVMEQILLYLQHCLDVESCRGESTTSDSTASSVSTTTGTEATAVASFKEGVLMWPAPTLVAAFVEKQLARGTDKEGHTAVQGYLSLCESASQAWSAPALEALVRLVAVAPVRLAPLYADRMDWLRRFLMRGGRAGTVAALLFGIVAGQVCALDQFERIVGTVCARKDLRLASQECCVLATGHSLAHARCRINKDTDVIMEDSWIFYDNTVVTLVQELLSGDAGLQAVLVVAVGEVARYSPLPLPTGDLNLLQEISKGKTGASKAKAQSSKDKVDASDDKLEGVKDKEDSKENSEASNDKKSGESSSKAKDTGKERKEATLVNLFMILSSIFNNNKLSSKLREQAIQTAGYMCVGQPDIVIKRVIIQHLLDLAEKSGDLDVHFSVGSSLADCVLGREAAAARNLWVEADPNDVPTPAPTNINEASASTDNNAVPATTSSSHAQDSETREKDEDEMMEKDERLKDEAMDTDQLTEAKAEAETNTKTEEKDVKKEAPAEAEAEAMEAEAQTEEGSLEWLLKQLLEKYVPMTKPSVRQASAIWLLTVLKRCRHRPEIQRKLTAIQGAFMNLLADSNEMVQDAASKGLGTVYECCGETTRLRMVEGLVHALTDGKGRVSEVTGDTKLFHEGELGNAPSGGQLSTYRELCSLASDLNQPDLVYKFMNLANHNAMWNSRKGAAFGFGSLAAQAGAQLEPFLPAIVPKLYRYQHDPTPRVQEPMAHIWACLVSDTHKTTEKYYSAILSDLLENLTSSTWRVRESCCSALSDLIRQHSVVPATAHLKQLWLTLFRVRDDVKESVRSAANKTLQTLCKSCIKVCEGGSAESQNVLEIVLPVLLTSGISSAVAEVRSVSLDAIVKMCRSGGAMIRPHLGTLVPALLEAIAGLEHQALSYTAVRTSTDDDRERVDTVRVAAARGTPMMDTLNYVLQYVDEQVLDSVVAGVVDVLKGSMGLTSRTAAAHVVETLTHTCPGPLEKHAGRILTALVNGLMDRNAVLRKIFATAIGNLVKVAKTSSVEKLLNKLQTWYLEKEEDNVRMSAAITLRSMHRQSGDIMREHATHALPLAFLAMHARKSVESDMTGTEIWEEIWQDNTPGTEGGLRLYLAEIIAVCEVAMLSNNWDMKAQAGRALATLAEKVGPTLSVEHATLLVKLLSNSLQGRTWLGKESLILALSTVAVNTKSILCKLPVKDDDSSLLEDVIKVLIREASKDKIEYKVFALEALTTVLEAYQEDKFEVVYDICVPHLNQLGGGPSETSIGCASSSGGGNGGSSGGGVSGSSAADGTEDGRSSSAQKEAQRWALLDEMFRSLGRAWPVLTSKDTQERYSVRFVELLNNSVSKVPRKSQLFVIGALGKYWERHYLLQDTSPATKLSIVAEAKHSSAATDAAAMYSTATSASATHIATTDAAATRLTTGHITDASRGEGQGDVLRMTDMKMASPDKSLPLYDPLLETLFDPVIQQSCKIFNYCLGISKYYSLRKQALTVLLDVVNRIKGNPIICVKLSVHMLPAVEEARRDSQPDIQALATTLYKIFVCA